MDKRNILITGASSGIGAALTSALAGDGHRLIVCARRFDRLREITADGAIAHPVACDVSSAGDVSALFDLVPTLFDKLDAVIHCAGAYGPIGPVTETDPDAWWSALRANLFGFFLIARAAVPLMEGAPRPRIVTFSGGGAFAPMPRYSAYATSKAGSVRLMETLAAEVAPKGIAVNAVAPGFVATGIHEATLEAGPDRAGPEFHEMTRRKLAGDSVPMEVPVSCVRYLLSPAADGLTGKTISAGFDPWGTPEFDTRIDEIVASDIYTMQRINLRHLDEDALSGPLSSASRRGHIDDPSHAGNHSAGGKISDQENSR
jgi:3-oxoacyl-[acyl-carrier protein] reductase